MILDKGKSRGKRVAPAQVPGRVGTQSAGALPLGDEGASRRLAGTRTARAEAGRAVAERLVIGLNLVVRDVAAVLRALVADTAEGLLDRVVTTEVSCRHRRVHSVSPFCVLRCLRLGACASSASPLQVQSVQAR